MNTVDFVSFGACGDGVFDNTEAFKKALFCENIRVDVPSGIYLTGPITLKSGTELHLQKGAVIRFIYNPDLYTPVYSRWEGIRCYCMHPCIYAENASDISVTGEGTIDGSGQFWWNAVREKMSRHAGPEADIEKQLSKLNIKHAGRKGGGGGWETQFLRPPMLQFNRCRNILIEDVTFTDSPFWTVHPVFCTDVEIKGVKIYNDPDSPNTDAMDIDSCTNVHISDCDISVGDDAITIKSGNGKDGIDAAWPTSDVLVENCSVQRAHGGAVIGSETAAGIHDIEFKNCRFTDTDRGIRIKTRRGRAGKIHDLKFSNIDIAGCLCPVTINMYYRCGTDEDWPFTKEGLPVTDVTPEISDIKIYNVRAKGCRSSAGFIVGLPESPIKNVEISDCDFSIGGELVSTDLSEMFRGIEHVEKRTIRIANAEIVIHNVSITDEKNREI